MSTRPRLTFALLAISVILPVHATTSFTITPTFDSSIANDTNSAAIENAINSAIAIYDGLFSNPINVTIEFKEMAGGLGGSSKSIYTGSYQDFFYPYYSANAAANNNPAAQTALADGVVPNQVNNPVNGGSLMALTTADIRALGISCSCPSFEPGGFDGIISLNTHITTPGSPGSSASYMLMPVVEHEIDEVLGLGSSLGQSFSADPSVEDLFRFDANGNRSYTTSTSAKAYFSIDGTTDLAQFDNQADGGDWGDWQSNPHGAGVLPQVQDAFATPGANPSLGVEVTALEAIGYDLATPEPGTMGLLGVSLTLMGLTIYRRRKSAAA